MDLTAVYSKTAKGVQAITQKGKRLPAKLARALSLVNGRATVEEILEKAGEPPTSTLPQILADLAKDGYLKAVAREPFTQFSSIPDNSASMVVSETIDETFFKVLAETEARKKLMKEAAENPQETRQKAHEKSAAMEEEEAMRRKNEAREVAEAEERSRREGVQRKIAEAMALEEASLKARKKAELQALREKAEKDTAEAEERARREAQEQAAKEAEIRAAAARKTREEAEDRAQHEAEKKRIAEAKARGEAERKAREEEEARILQRKIEKDRAEAEEQARREKVEKEKAEAEERLRQEAQEKSAKEARIREAAERKAQEEAAEIALAKEEAERKETREREEAEARAKAEAEEEARAEARRQLRLEARAREEAEAKAKAEAEARAIMEAEEKARAEEEARIKAEAEARAQEEAEHKAREEAEAWEKQEAEARAIVEAEERARAEEESRIKAEAEASEREEAERKAREDEEDRKKREAEVRAIVEAEERARAEEESRIKAEAEASEREEAERKAREDEEARAIAEVEERTRWEAEEKIRAQEEALAKARAEADRKAREEAEQEKRERADIEARARALADARAEEAEKARQKALAKPRKFKHPIKWGKAAAISLAALILLPIVLLQVMSLNIFIPPIEKLASNRMGEPVSISSMRASLWPAPHLQLEGITIGKLRDIKIPTVRVIPELAAFFGETKMIKAIQVESVTIDQDALTRAIAWVGPSDSAEKIQARRIVIKTATIDVKGIPLPPFEVEVALAETGKFEQANIRSTDKKIEVAITPKSEGFEVNIAANDWQPPLWPNLTFTELHAKAMATSGSMRISEIEGRLYGGKAKGNATIKWGDLWSAEGDLYIENILLAGVMPALTNDMALSGKLDAKTVYSMQSRDLGTLFDNPRIKTSFNVRDGAIDNIDLARAIQPRATETTGGKTLFATLSGSMTLDRQRYQYRQMKLAAGLLTASGEADIMPDKKLTGKTSIEMKLPSSTIRARLTLSGDLKQPVLRQSR
ncbi:hypothetical protein SCD_n02749 [Sulfuricella denitrificans skB26]|uniref:AsmA-like C-terminal domain-containing protein n=1 Tax=Sulfuricella denitrificans (strain DSM 22764 / NBRC 105220 / skB26) TaxID=1163617 RepID=S6ANT0_SULDS|nr:hypothetical protein [Sulfuricella denitrificans]BAN36549.1 hypothetical protein SCD_n02749 [Sulfuricella denitrificans skB26]